MEGMAFWTKHSFARGLKRGKKFKKKEYCVVGKNKDIKRELTKKRRLKQRVRVP
jgi:hypothetical protein